jgi:hypothetical protein
MSNLTAANNTIRAVFWEGHAYNVSVLEVPRPQSCLWMECYSTPVDTPVLDSSGVDSSRGWSGVE